MQLFLDIKASLIGIKLTPSLWTMAGHERTCKMQMSASSTDGRSLKYPPGKILQCSNSQGASISCGCNMYHNFFSFLCSVDTTMSMHPADKPQNHSDWGGVGVGCWANCLQHVCICEIFTTERA